jgi:hypothetical protein
VAGPVPWLVLAYRRRPIPRNARGDEAVQAAAQGCGAATQTDLLFIDINSTALEI